MPSQLKESEVPTTGGNGYSSCNHVAIAHSKLDAEEAANTVNRRRHTRYPYRSVVTIELTHPGGGTVQKAVECRDLSAGGVAFLYNGFVYPGTACSVTLLRRLGGKDIYKGKVTNCRHVQGTVHIIGVSFREQIFPKQYVDPNFWQHAEETICMQDLSGNLLLLDDRGIDHLHVQKSLRETPIKLIVEKDVQKFIERAKQPDITAVMTELTLTGSMQGEQLIVKLREADYTHPIIVITAESRPARLIACRTAGATTVIHKPFSAQQLVNGIGPYFKKVEQAVSEPPIYSSLFTPSASVMETEEMLRQYLQQVNAASDDLRKAMSGHQIEAIRCVCQVLKGSGSSFGFEKLTEVAGHALLAIEASSSIEESTKELNSLEAICKRLNCTAPAAATTAA